MMTLVKPTAAQVQLKQGSLVRLGKCVSGVLGQHPLYRRLALATEPALEKLAADRPLQLELQAQIKATGEVRYKCLSGAGFDYYSYNGSSFGLLDPKTANDRETYAAAEDAMLELGPGEHRRIFLGTWGVSAPAGVANMPTHLYSALITRMAKIARDPTFSRTSAIELADAPFDQIKPNDDGSQIFVVSLPQLEKERGMFKLEIGTIRIETENGKKSDLLSRFWAWLKREG
jgi:hypothetical protein